MSFAKPAPILLNEHRSREERCRRVARQLGFDGRVEYRHLPTRSGGAQFIPGPLGDTLAVYAEAFRRNDDPDDFSLRAIIAHERGHQIFARDPRLSSRVAGMPLMAEEVMASLIGARLVGTVADREALVAKAISDLLDSGAKIELAVRLVGDLSGILGELL